METKIETTTLNNGTVVLAKTDKYGTHAAVYVNFKQADRKVAELQALGIKASVIGYGHPAKHIKIEQEIDTIKVLEVYRTGDHQKAFELASQVENFNPDATFEQFTKWAEQAIHNEDAQTRANKWFNENPID